MRARTVALAVAGACAASCLVSYVRAARLRGAPVVPLQVALAGAKTGDLVVFRHRKAPWDVQGQVSLMVSAVTHAGLVVRDADGTVRVVETHAAGDTRALGVQAGGVNTYPLEQRARAYAGDVYLCRLAVPLDAGRERALRAALRELAGVPFETGFRTHYLRRCVVRAGQRAAEPRDKMFCSEFVGLALVRAGLLPRETDTQCLTPESFLDARVDGHPLYTDLVRLAT